MSYLIDTNILVRQTDASSPDRALCSRAVDRLIDGGCDLCICAQVVIEFWSVSTRPQGVNGLGLTPRVASLQVADFKRTFLCLLEPPDMADRWKNVADRHAVIGKQAHDARLATIMLAHGVAHILTLNPGDFTRYSGITPITPQEVLESLS